MYILAKSVDDGYAVTIHGVTENEEVADAWQAMNGVVFDLDSGEGFSKEPLPWMGKDNE